jgi:hypothetical protein
VLPVGYEQQNHVSVFNTTCVGKTIFAATEGHHLTVIAKVGDVLQVIAQQ